MLQIKNVKKQYQTGEYIQTALDDVSLNLRDNEFVAILGPSGSGKTTLLNIVGGLDRYDEGDLIVNAISTKKYKDKDWDSYRNHSIGFVFQSYNLIGHQSVLTNVELALTISGVSKAQRRKKAIDALTKVGLEQHIHKKPNQLSGGQMQRVAIARALVNNPEILLADEPTGALDSETSVQIMNLLKEVAKDRLVVMVTHNPELAEEYATRIIKLKDGKIIDDNDPFVPHHEQEVAEYQNMGKASMSFLTSVSLSFNNLKTKKGRTFLTAFAGSIGIIGIALIVSISSGVNTYIEDIQKETMSSYPVTISSQTIDSDSILDTRQSVIDDFMDESSEVLDAVYGDNMYLEAQESFNTSIVENDLTNFKVYLDDPDSEINQYVGENGVVYTYDVQFDVYATDSEGTTINTNDDPQEEEGISSNDAQLEMLQSLLGTSSSSGADNFSELMANSSGDGISSVISDSYDLLAGDWASEYNEVVLVLGSDNQISTTVLYQLGLITRDEYDAICDQISDGETGDILSFDYDDLLGYTFSLVPYCDYYSQEDNGIFSYSTEDIDSLLDNSIELSVVGIIKSTEDAVNDTIATNVAYTSALTSYIIDYTDDSAVVLAQEEDESINILTGVSFEEEDDDGKVATTIEYLSNLSISEKASVYSMMMSDQTSQFTSEEQMATALDYWLASSPDQEVLLTIYDTYLDQNSYIDNLSAFGKVSYDAPSSISIYTDSFEDKDAISLAIENYNETVDEDAQITYTDYVALLTSSLTSIIDVISYVLIAFVSVSLIVSCVMIGIITHISVLERTKEIGILRAIGASKRNISQVFNAETLIIGLFAGTIGIVVTLLLIIPINSILHFLTANESINAVLPINVGIILIMISVVITVLAGLLPAKSAAKKDPVIALRSE